MVLPEISIIFLYDLKTAANFTEDNIMRPSNCKYSNFSKCEKKNL